MGILNYPFFEVEKGLENSRKKLFTVRLTLRVHILQFTSTPKISKSIEHHSCANHVTVTEFFTVFLCFIVMRKK